MTDLPPPFTPPDSDLADFGFMPLDVVRFRNSDLVALSDPEAVLAALLLWGVAWHGKPAASLTDNDRALAQAAGYGRAVDAFLRVKDEALRGFVRCSDARLYHPVVAEKAVEAWEGKLKQRHRTYLAAIRKHNERDRENGGEDQRQALSFDDWNDAGRPEKVTRDKLVPSRVTKSPELPLEVDSCARARTDAREQVSGQPAENNQIGNVTPPGANVTRDIDDSHAEKQRDKASKGQGEGQGQGDSIRTSPQSSESRAKVEDEGNDLLGLTTRLARIGGVSLMPHSALLRAIDVVKAWKADGLDIENVVVPAIEKAVLDAPPGGVHSLAYFDRTIRTQLARKNGAKRQPPAKPKAPIRTKDDDDPRVAQVREEFARQVGDRIAGHWLDPTQTAIRLNGSALIVDCANDFLAKWLTDHYSEQLRKIAQDKAGMRTLRIEVEQP